MNTTVLSLRSDDRRNLDTLHAVDPRGLSTFDRLELRLGLWLLLRSARRHDAARDRVTHARRRSVIDHHERRVHADLRRHLLHAVRT